MNIAIDGRAAELYRGTGIGTYTYQLLNNLNQLDFLNDYMIFTPKTSSLNINFKKNFSLSKANENPSSNFWEKIKVPNILNNNNVELYHVPQNGVGLSENIDCLSAITLHDIIPLRMPETCSNRYLKIFNEEMPKIIEKCDGIITVSQFSKNDISKEFNFPENKIFVTPLAPEDIYKPLNKQDCRKTLKSKYGISNDFILYVGGFSPRKNILGLIESFSLLLKKHKNHNLNLIILGSHGISYEIYKKRTEELKVSDKVLFPGFIPLSDMPIFYNAAKIFVYPSFYEGFGLPPLEAMACGTPVITSSLTSIPEVVGDCAVTIDPNNIYELKNNIERLLEDKNLYKDLVFKSIQHSSYFNWKNTACYTIDAYNSIINS
ncbi:glycosyltransferase family 4 protein [Clostridium fallax]|uniref:Glycosyltransferase involved in cell wall bisynthesis n=1 Tax=Clostridium fallax TaxID=1533 RepID=A0A1M4WI04_9CLOT|nr:glycosyltransferase family 1 protein [Clostridium fallax]SHE80683.1 Glycosyltransferase involved in cell wall bisynthesis [Clostridium fallax]SQB05712.1 mannosyltransferase B [Clostridium fallax]